MRLERLKLKNFRSYSNQTFNFGEANLVRAPNGYGKSNLLEAINLVSTGVSERAGKIEEMIKWGSEFASVSAIIAEAEGSYRELSVVLTRGMIGGKRSPKRRYLVDGVARSRTNFAGQLSSILFAPEDLRLVEGSPTRRRRYLDTVLSQAHPDYGRALATYEASLLRRNRLLDQIREGRSKREELAYWDASLVKNGNIVADYRRDYLGYLTSEVEVSYGRYKIEYLSSSVSPARLAQYAQAEVAAGHTLIGPHKDDFRVFAHSTQLAVHNGDVDLMIYGSRGEQRLGVLYLKIGSMRYLERALGVKPIILLDDIFSELDEGNRREILELKREHQIIITTAERELGITTTGMTELTIESMEQSG